MGNANKRQAKVSGDENGLGVGRGGQLPATGGLPSMITSIVRFSSPADKLESETASASSPAYACSSVQGKRAGMEDEHIAIRPLFVNREEAANLFGVFDGHGGKTVAVFLRENMPHALSWSVQSAVTSRTSVERALKEAFLQVTPLFYECRINPNHKTLNPKH
jgi:hypothetical protein